MVQLLFYYVFMENKLFVFYFEYVSTETVLGHAYFN